ncbi:unnamed protein product, partial [Mesorhabditis spiculigera]
MSNSTEAGEEGAAALRLALTITHLILVCIGFFNLLVVFMILLKPYMRSITNVYILSLCLADFIYLFDLSFVAATQLNQKSWPFGEMVCTFFHGSEATGKYASVLFVVLLAADRYCAMCKPSVCARYRNYQTAIGLSLAAWMTALFISMPLYFVSEVMPIVIERNNERKLNLFCIVKWPGKEVARTYIGLSSISIFFIPLGIIVYCYYHILNKLREAVQGSKRLRRAGTTKAPYQRVTRLVLWVVIFHVICWSPYWIFNMLSSIFTVKMSSWLERIVINIIYLFPYINCALNPLLYGISSDNFRMAFRSVFCCRKEVAPPREGKSYMATRSTYVRNTVQNGSPIQESPVTFYSAPTEQPEVEEARVEQMLNTHFVRENGQAKEPLRALSVSRPSVRRSFCNLQSEWRKMDAESGGDWRKASNDEIRRLSRASARSFNSKSSGGGRMTEREKELAESGFDMMLSLLTLGLFATATAQQFAPQAQPVPQNGPRVLFQAEASSSAQLDPCQYLLSNLTSVERLEDHEFSTLEQCLYYNLAGETAKRMRRFGIPHPIAAVPPNYISKKPVNIHLDQLTLQHFELNEFLKDVAIHGYMDINWEDDRLTWDEGKWKINHLQIQSVSHIWIPVFIANNYETALKNGDAFELRKVETTNKGNVTATMAFSLRAFCDDSDFQNYPDDIYKCCFSLEPHVNADVIEFTTSNKPIFTDPKYFRDYGWRLSGTIPTAQTDPAQVAQYNFCINLQRSSSAVRIELTVPLMVVALIFLLTPFIGRIMTQVYIKLALVGLQFLTFQLYSARIAPHLGSAAATPKLMRFLEFSVTINTVSIAISILIHSISRIRRELPPWGKLIQISNIVNKFLCVIQAHAPEEEIELGAKATTNYQKDWLNAFIAMHNLAMLVITFVFLVGYVIIL